MTRNHEGLLIGYARVSTAEQDLTAQQIALADLGVDPERVYVDHRLFESIASWLRDVATGSGSGVVLVLDDLHWATKPTLQLLVHVARAASTHHAPLLIVATYRDTDVDRTHPLSSLLSELRRLDGVSRIAVDNLSATEVVDMIEVAAGHELDADTLRLAGAIHAETDGNPFFVAEVLRHLIESGGVRREDDRWYVSDPEQITVPKASGTWSDAD
jgi:predicted ATPase